jgi:hypothetical protein
MSDLFEEPIFHEWKKMEIRELREFDGFESIEVDNPGSTKEEESLSIKVDDESELRIRKLKDELFNSKSDRKNALDKVDDFLRKFIIIKSVHDFSDVNLWFVY